MAGDFPTEQSSFKLRGSYFFNLQLFVALHPFPQGSGRHQSWTLHGFLPAWWAAPQPRQANWEPGSAEEPAAFLALGIPGS